MTHTLGMIHIVPTHAPALKRALDRALVSGIASHYLDHYTIAHAGDSRDSLLVTSSSEPDVRYAVKVVVRGRDVWTHCQCRAGSVGTICQHSALALHLLGLTQALVTASLLEADLAAVEAMRVAETAVAA